MLSLIEMFDYARTLSQPGLEDLHCKLLSRQSNARKELLEVIDRAIDVAAEAQIVGLLRAARATVAPQRPAGPQRPERGEMLNAAIHKNR